MLVGLLSWSWLTLVLWRNPYGVRAHEARGGGTFYGGRHIFMRVYPLSEVREPFLGGGASMEEEAYI